jgi:hypothetical protein
LEDIASFFIKIFKSTIIHNIGNQINSQMQPQLNQKVHYAILDSNGIMHLANYLELDIQFPQPPVVTIDKFGLYLNATLFNPKYSL